jgi:hypothetical protein
MQHHMTHINNKKSKSLYPNVHIYNVQYIIGEGLEPDGNQRKKIGYLYGMIRPMYS